MRFFALLQWKLTVSIGFFDSHDQYIRFNIPIIPNKKEIIRRTTKAVFISIEYEFYVLRREGEIAPTNPNLTLVFIDPCGPIR